MGSTVRTPAEPTLRAQLSAEFAGTAILILFGCGVDASVTAAGRGDADSVSWGWGLGVVLGIYTAGRLTGAHLNPAVTLALATFRGFAWSKVGPYALAQLAGAFAGAVVVRYTYGDLIRGADPGLGKATLGIFATSPGVTATGSPVGVGTAFADQVVGTAILVFLVLALTSARNTPPLANLTPWFVGMVVVGLGMAWGANAGYAINPARDLGPRLAAFVTGYGTDAWRSTSSDVLYFWVPLVAPLLGALVGGALFSLLIERHLPEEPVDDAPDARGERGVAQQPAAVR
ncbi:aquaporin family protein [Nocardioides sp. TRM66260-LWL]|uniref:MIP/aquaporin family protein n=1 Tax=Nocardioides sp. TRM66260-LWL TaxID=2874478 RepID=UPI001CC5B5E2|nr:MIP/aquaporin family protein [Nocardioides sp. TRM66260-LWL]MBZ5734026.1 aquaporin family protein [Nocardioides sp. TRM66260-LWL]